MHECNDCGYECDCDMEDHSNPTPDDCRHDCEDDFDDDDDWEAEANSDYVRDGLQAVRGQL